jgi:ABC-2 type transport system permease protein
MSVPLLKLNLKSNWVILVLFTVLMAGYLVLILSMYDEEIVKTLEAMVEMYPPGMLAAVGMDRLPANLTDFAASYYYDFLVQLLLLVHVILLPIRLVVKHVDNGSMSYLLSTPNSRVKIVATQAVYLAMHLGIMMIAVTAIAVAFSQSLSPGALDIPRFLSLNLATCLTALAMAAIVFFFSCIWNSTIDAAATGSAVLVLFFIFSTIGRFGHHEGIFGIFSSISIFRFLQARAIINGEINMWINDLVLVLIIFGFIGTGIVGFKRKDLPF